MRKSLKQDLAQHGEAVARAQPAHQSRDGYKRVFAPVIPWLRAQGLGKTQAHVVKRSGILKTFFIGNREFAEVAHLESISEVLASEEGRAKVRAARYPRRARAESVGGDPS